MNDLYRANKGKAIIKGREELIEYLGLNGIYAKSKIDFNTKNVKGGRKRF